MVQLKIHTIYNSAPSSSSSGLANTGGLAGPGSSRPPSAACSMCSSGFTTQVMILHRPSTFFFFNYFENFKQHFEGHTNTQMHTHTNCRHSNTYIHTHTHTLSHEKGVARAVTYESCRNITLRF